MHPIVLGDAENSAYAERVHQPVNLEVYVTPPPSEVLRDAAVVVIDVLRATTVHEALLSGGAGAIYPVADFAAGVELRDKLGSARLIGEIGALPPPEADFGNSPTEFASLNVEGWTVVHVTSNGTRALLGAESAVQVYSGCLRNLSLTVERILAAATERIAVVCSGDQGGTAPSVEDTFAGGAYVAAFRQAAPKLVLGGGARLALRLYEAYDHDPMSGFDDSPHAEHLRSLGFDADLAYAAQVDASAVAAVLDRDAAGRVFVRSG